MSYMSVIRDAWAEANDTFDTGAFDAYYPEDDSISTMRCIDTFGLGAISSRKNRGSDKNVCAANIRHITFYVGEDMAEDVRYAATDMGVSVSEFIRMAIASYVGEGKQNVGEQWIAI